MTTADQFHPGEPAGTTYGDVSGADSLPEHGEQPMDESAFDEDPSADEPAAGDDIYANPASVSADPPADLAAPTEGRPADRWLPE